MGNPQTNALRANPEIRELYEQYLLCRTTEFLVVRKPQEDGKEQVIVMTHTTGIGTWPKPGGLENQSYYVTKMFAAFLRGDQIAANRRWEMA